VITTVHKGDMLFETKLGNHVIKIDVPSSMGGKDRGPTPPELFVASLGSCIAAFAASYCHQAGIDTKDLSVDLSFDKVQDPVRLVNLKATVNLPKGDCRRREQAILRAAEHCPVHETIAMLECVQIELVGPQEMAPAF